MSATYHDEENGPLREIPPLTDDETDGESQNRDFHVDNAPEEGSDEPDLPLPIWMRESAKNFKYKWIPLPVRKGGRAVVNWVKGPDPTQHMSIEPWFPYIQEAPIKLLDRFAPKKRHRIFLLLLVYSAWLLTWSLMVWHNSTGGYIQGLGKPSSLWCGASFW